MRYVTLRARPTDGVSFHPIGAALGRDPDIERGNIYHVEALDDGTGLLLAEARGNVDRYREILTDSDYVVDFSVLEQEGWAYAYTHFEQTPATEEMMRIRQESELAMEMPIEVEADGAMVFTLVGPERAVAGLPAEGDSYDLEVIETGDHHPELGDLFLSLTDRQREVLEAAVDLGYYENPRAATHEDIAAAVDAAPSTVGEHLKKIESRVFSQLVRDG